jgi:hypothetical protein
VSGAQHPHTEAINIVLSGNWRLEGRRVVIEE